MNTIMGEPSMIDTGVLKRNPFPGIRPFTSAEDKYFFGRDGVTVEVLELLQANRFVALVGASGSGKTSLVQSGIIPALITDEKQEWVPVSIRPGLKPLESLIRGFQQVFPNKLKETDVQAFLSGAADLGELINEKGLGSHNYFLVVDQFEDLFRSGPAGKTATKDPETRRFIDLLIRAVKRDRPGIFVMLSIRSDFIEDSSAFRGLTELMNRSKYLLPHMSREALSASISGPVQAAGARLEPGFVEYLLDDLEEVDIPLPQLQHALMRTWDYWSQQGDREKPVSISDYQAIGTVKTALSNHLDEAFDELDENQKLICERLFKSITSKSEQNNGFKRLASLGNIARIAHCSFEEVVEVVEVYRRPGRAFLSPHATVSLSSDTLIELSHESLIRIWDRLLKWVDEEDESIKMYLRLSEASALYQQGRTELWKNPELQLAINWKDSQKPTPAWGVQFNPAFERAMVFLSTSQEEMQWEEERKVILQKRRLLVNRAIAIFMGVLVVALAAIFIITRNRPEKPVQAAQAITEDYSVPSPEARTETVTPLQEMEPEPIIQETEPARSEPPATSQNLNNTPQQGTSRQTTGRESTGGTTARTQATRAPVTPRESQTSRQVTETPPPAVDEDAAGMARRSELVALAKNVAEQSLTISQNPDLQGLLAFQAYRINARNDGKYYDVDIYKGLYEALKKLISPAYNIYPNIRNSIKDMVWLSRTGSILTVSSDGSVKILSGNYANRASQINLVGTGLNNECVAISPDERRAVIGTNGGGLLFIELENQGNVIHQNTEDGTIVLFLQNLGNSGSFISAGTENRILKWDYNSFESSELVATTDRPSALGVSADGKKIAYGTRDGSLFELDMNSTGGARKLTSFDRNSVRAIAYSPGGQNMVLGMLDGSLRVLAGQNRQVVASLRGPGARVSDLAYSSDGRFLVAASHDGNVYLWNTTDWNNPPLVFSENNGFVLTVCFSGNGKTFYSGSVDYPRFLGRPTESAQMVENFCSLLGRNLTQAEWDQYIGNNVPYEKTCPGLN
jgi:WD40 repeat protein/energy-coupling factor transporter ATP-binding protein EcfA2